MSCCTNEHDICVIRGDSFSLVTGLAQGWEDVAADPSGWNGRLAFRTMQNDTLPDVWSQEIPLTPGNDPRFPGMDWLMEFSAPPDETQQLPPYELV
jgi:hypothetical protein